MDEIDKVQKYLEGLCYECNQELPKHTGTCSLNPHVEIVKRLMKLSQHTGDIQRQAVEMLSQLDPETLETIIKTYNANKQDD